MAAARRGSRANSNAAAHRHHVISLSPSPEPGRRISPGNNRFGARGTLKCLNCRNRKARCEFASKDEDCRWCAQRGLNCGEKLLGEKHQIREHRKLLGIGNTPLSVIASQLELAYPRRTPWEISEMAREALILAGDGPQSENLSQDGRSASPHAGREESVKIENSPKTPPMTLQSQTFLNASQQKSPPSQRPEPRSTLSLEQLPTYEHTTEFQAPSRQNFEERDPLYDPNDFAEVSPSPFTFNLSREWWTMVPGPFISL